MVRTRLRSGGVCPRPEPRLPFDLVLIPRVLWGDLKAGKCQFWLGNSWDLRRQTGTLDLTFGPRKVCPKSGGQKPLRFSSGTCLGLSGFIHLLRAGSGLDLKINLTEDYDLGGSSRRRPKHRKQPETAEMSLFVGNYRGPTAPDRHCVFPKSRETGQKQRKHVHPRTAGSGLTYKIRGFWLGLAKVSETRKCQF